MAQDKKYCYKIGNLNSKHEFIVSMALDVFVIEFSPQKDKYRKNSKLTSVFIAVPYITKRGKKVNPLLYNSIHVNVCISF